MIKRFLEVLTLPFMMLSLVVYGIFIDLPISLYRYVIYGEEF